MKYEFGNISWNTLSSNTDNPTTIPALLSELFNNQEESHFPLLEELGNAIYAQGNFFEVTPVVIPFLLTYIERASGDELSYILGLLAILVRETELADISNTSSLIYKNICDGVSQYNALLRENDETDICLLLSFILGLCAHRNPESIHLLKAKYSEIEDEMVRFVIIRSLLLLEGLSEQEIIAFWEKEQRLVVHCALALAWAPIVQERIPDEAEQIFLKSLIHREIFAEIYMHVPYNRDIVTDICAALTFIPRSKSVSLLAKAISLCQSNVTKLEVIQFTESLLNLADFQKHSKAAWDEVGKRGIHEFYYPILRSKPILTHFSKEQIEALLSILQFDPFWKLQTNLLEAYSLPMDKSELQQLIIANNK